MPKIYVAGPLFTEGERWLLEKIDAVCREAGYETYLPHRDAGVFDRDSDSSPFFQQDLLRLQEADVVVPTESPAVTVRRQKRAMWTFLVKHGEVVGALKTAKLLGLVSDRAYQEYHQRAINALAPTLAGKF